MSASARTSSPVRGGSGEMFDAIAERYDLVNRVISLGIDQSWRRKTVQALALPPAARVLDLATGTADLALMIATRHPDSEVTGLDVSERMLEVGRQKVDDRRLSARVRLVHGSAEALPFDDATFDGVCIAFGIRNVSDRGLALRELARVTRPGGRVAVLELSEPEGGLLGPLARFHVHSVVPWIGSLLSGAREYRYLERSIAAFPRPSEFAALMRGANLDVLEVESLTFGVAQLFVATPVRQA